MANKPRLYRVVADTGDDFFGTVNHLNRLTKEYRDQVLEQIELMAQGKEASPVKIPVHELESAGWMTEQVAQEFVGHRPPTPEPVKSEDENTQPEHTLKPPAATPSYARSQTGSWQPTNMCDQCPLRKIAEKLIEKTMEKL